ncbi:nucleoporin NUP42-like [Octopus sinensis]|uniref:Nucleoporin NUP42-like n=1 Tax=Octopus sinensis TaxID=2607531 RepID=A0A7E6EN88_9MOLL|nr:nucleoporin NUP42-like [Octopus sinensis]
MQLKGFSLYGQRQLNFDNYESREARGNVFQSNNRQQMQPQQQNKFKWVAPHLSTGSEAAPQMQQQQQQSPQEIISTLSREISNWEVGKMWLLSCISFGKSGPSIPGMVDMSPDELRCEAYNALKNEQFQNYVLKVQQMHNDYSAKRQELKNPSAQLKDKLIQFIESNRRQSLAPVSSPSSPAQSSAFGSSNAFGQSLSFVSGASKVFGQQESGSTPFQSQGSAFGGNSSGNMMCNYANVPNQGNNTFGNVSSVFGGVQTAASPLQNTFGNSSTLNTVQPIGANSQMSVFGNSAPSLNQNTSFGSVFGNSSLSSNVSASSGAGLFGKPGLAPAPAPSQQSSVFGQQPVQQSSVFGSAMPSGMTGSVFDQVPSVGSSVFTPQSPPSLESLTIYTPFEDLTPPELEQYQAQKFILGKIPTRPPPKELCF